MPETLVLLPGWGLGPAALEPLAQALRLSRPGAQVLIEPLPLGSDLEQVLAELDRAVAPGAWLLGWSLGGMLAVALAARRGAACPGLISIASNACFVAREGWPAAMAAETFDAFERLCANDPAATLKRFVLLCAQGSPAARALAKQLMPADARHADPGGLALLAALDNRAALAALAVPHLHLFASADALVPAQAAQALAQAAPQARVAQAPGSHALVLEAPTALASQAWAFIEEFIHG
ncbi:alpha/beta fold hydrolase [Pseudomonas sp. RIT-PI-S]|uniref:alpha/beta fold hydrolase n=1 Tax=Pseudomonas sp. RIT-PI-S TaxID=3035295 RepID=UPI0021D88B56|nr:alpha/beta fold hydrolase [Pseudomonas sp. RIT-PI-S]